MLGQNGIYLFARLRDSARLGQKLGVRLGHLYFVKFAGRNGCGKTLILLMNICRPQSHSKVNGFTHILNIIIQI